MTNFLTMRHECRDFAQWKPVYDADAPNRAAAGLTDLLCMRGADNPNLVGLIFAVADVAKAKAMAGSPQLREAMDRAGVVGAPVATFRFGEYEAKAAAHYLTLYFKVSSFDTFMRGYAMDAADRRAAGLTDLAVMQNAEDGHALFLLWAVADVDKVKAFLASPALAAHQVEHAGVISKPEARFWTAA